MDRQIPHVLDVFTSSPGARRRARTELLSQEKEELQKNSGSDSAVSVGSSDEDEGEEQRNISRYFDYLEAEISSKSQVGSTSNKGSSNQSKEEKRSPVSEINEKNKVKERPTRKGEYEKDIRHLERHLSMKKTIRKKIMRDLQQAFVEDPKDLQQDPKELTKEKKNNIDINNLTFSKNRISKSEHNFLDMLKDDQTKERKGLRALMDFRKEKLTVTAAETTDKSDSSKARLLKPDVKDRDTKSLIEGNRRASEEAKADGFKIRDDDSGHGSPTREPPGRSSSRADLVEDEDVKDGTSKKTSFWKRITGKGKNKR